MITAALITIIVLLLLLVLIVGGLLSTVDQLTRLIARELAEQAEEETPTNRIFNV